MEEEEDVDMGGDGGMQIDGPNDDAGGAMAYWFAMDDDDDDDDDVSLCRVDESRKKIGFAL